MARRTKEQMAQEFDRLWAIFEIIIDFQHEDAPETAMHWEDVPSKDAMLARVDARTATMGQIARGTAEAIEDFKLGLRDFDPARHALLTPKERGPHADRFLAYYTKRTGRLFWVDAP